MNPLIICMKGKGHFDKNVTFLTPDICTTYALLNNFRGLWKEKKIITRMQRLIVVQMVSIIPLVQFPSSWDICLIGCKQPSALFDLGSPSHKSSLDNHSDSFLLVEFSDLNRLWVSLSVVMSPSFPTATCPNPPTHTVSFPARLLHCPRTFSSSDCQIRLHVFLLFYCGLKSPGVNSALSPASALGEYLTELFLRLLF